jgi:WD40 repeat protein
MRLEEALALVNEILKQEPLNDVHELVFRQCWEGKTYPEIANQVKYDPEYVKYIGFQLWQLLSEKLGEKVTKNNFRSVLRRYATVITESTEVQALIPVLQPEGNRDISLKQPTHRYDWGDAIDASAFYGRTEELKELARWIVNDRCRLVAILGMGGIGKTALTAKLVEQIQPDFQYMVWKSLRNAPPVETVLTDLLQFISGVQSSSQVTSIDSQISQLIDCLREHRCLLILDNFETILQNGEPIGRYREGYQGYGQLMRRVGEAQHQSCLLLTSREKPVGLAEKEGESLPIRSRRLLGLMASESKAIFADKGTFEAAAKDWSRLIDYYAGNPLALKIIAALIKDCFQGNISNFLASTQQQTHILGDLQALLEQQFNRLSDLERSVMYWVAIHREAVTLPALQADFASQELQSRLLNAVVSLQRRSLMEQAITGFTQQPVVMEYITERLIEQCCHELMTGEISLLMSHALMKAQAKDYIREMQSRLILEPILHKLKEALNATQAVENQLLKILAQLKMDYALTPGYGGGNLINLLSHLGSNLTNCDFSQLTIWQAYLRNLDLHHVNFSNCNLDHSVFTETFGGILSVEISPDGQMLATGDTECNIRLWQIANGKQTQMLSGHTSWVWSVAFDSSGEYLASASHDSTIRLWDPHTGQCLQVLCGHRNNISAVVFSPDSQRLASCGEDTTIKLWDLDTGECLQTLSGHEGRCWAVVFSPDGQRLASASIDKTIKLWNAQTGELLQTFQGHAEGCRSVAFSPDGTRIVSASYDRTIRLWDVETGECLQLWRGHKDLILTIAFSPVKVPLITGAEFVVASSSYDGLIKLWNATTGECLRTLQGHTSWVWSIVFHPQGHTLVSGGDDHAVRFWDVQTGQCFKTFQGHTNATFALALDPAGQRLASGSEDEIVRLWDPEGGTCLQTLVGHTSRIVSVSFSADGQRLISSSGDRTIKLWDATTGQCLKTFRGHTRWVWAAAFSPDDSTLVSCSEDSSVRVWDVYSGACLSVLQGHQGTVYDVKFSPDGKLIASGGGDGTVKLWDAVTGDCLQTLEGHSAAVSTIVFTPLGAESSPNPCSQLLSGSADRMLKLWDLQTGTCLQTYSGHLDQIWSIAISPDGLQAASGSQDRTIKLWELNSGACLKTLTGHMNLVKAIVFHPRGQTILSCSLDETIRYWNLSTGEDYKTLRIQRPYEGMNITGVKGLTEAQKATLIALGAMELAD